MNNPDESKQVFFEGTDQPCMISTVLTDPIEGNITAGQIRIFNLKGEIIEHSLIQKGIDNSRTLLDEYKKEGQTHLLDLFLNEYKRIKDLVK